MSGVLSCNEVGLAQLYEVDTQTSRLAEPRRFWQVKRLRGRMSTDTPWPLLLGNRPRSVRRLYCVVDDLVETSWRRSNGLFASVPSALEMIGHRVRCEWDDVLLRRFRHCKMMGDIALE